MGRIQTLDQISAGGVAYRYQDNATEVALIRVSSKNGDRWQLPKGLVGRAEEPEAAALREVHEEAGIEATSEGLIETIEYWYYALRGSKRVRYHKLVHFYLMRAMGGDVDQHDHEVLEARWVSIGAAAQMLAFKSEQRVVEQVRAKIEAAG